MKRAWDAVVVGAGPNGLGAAITLAQAGKKVLLLEAASEVGGGARSARFNTSEVLHDVCSGVYPLGACSPFFRRLPLDQYGLEWITPPISLAHPFEDRPAACLYHSLDKTARSLEADEEAYRAWISPFLNKGHSFVKDALAPAHLPKHPLLLARFGMASAKTTKAWIKTNFKTARAQALFAGLACHSNLPMSKNTASGMAILLALASHLEGWPIAKGGAKSVSIALAGLFKDLGGKIKLNHKISGLRELPSAKTVFWDLSPWQLSKIMAEKKHFEEKMAGENNDIVRLNKTKRGPGVFKMDWVLKKPVPWKDPACALASTVHLGATFEEVERSEEAPWRENLNNKQRKDFFMITSEPTRFDRIRAPDGKHVLWGYIHVKNGSSENFEEKMEAQIERFAPGFKETILARHSIKASDYHLHNASIEGGDIGFGAIGVKRLLFGPNYNFKRTSPYSLSKKGHFICSSAAPPGPGVHGLCGYYAAKDSLKNP